MDGLFTKEGITGMIVTSDMKRIDIISPILGALIDCVSDEQKTCPIANMFTAYVDIMRYMCGITKGDKWKEEELEKRAERIKKCKIKCVSIFSTYQKSGMCTMKQHFFDHICEDIKLNCSFSLCSADLFAYVHNIFKREYRKTTKRRAT